MQRHRAKKKKTKIQIDHDGNKNGATERRKKTVWDIWQNDATALMWAKDKALKPSHAQEGLILCGFSKATSYICVCQFLQVNLSALFIHPEHLNV